MGEAPGLSGPPSISQGPLFRSPVLNTPACKVTAQGWDPRGTQRDKWELVPGLGGKQGLPWKSWQVCWGQ